MKLLIVMISLVSSIAFANQCGDTCEVLNQDVNTPVPVHLKGATITVTTKDGKSYEMKADEFKVVPRKQQFKVKERVVYRLSPQPREIEPVVIEKTRVQKQKNIVSLLLNRSLTDYDVSQDGPGSFRIENRFELAVGLMYQRNVYKDLYLGVQADTHKSLGANLGIGF